EDTSNNKAYQLGNTSITAGLYFPYLFSEKLSLNYEYSDWQTGWYNNNVYQEGYVNEAFVLGHWAMQPQREMNTTTPGLSHYLKTQWQFGNDHLLSTQLRYSELQSTPTINFSNAWEINLDYTIPWESDIVTLGAYFGEDSFGEKFSQVSLTWEI
ncbi:MAG: capsule assembly Wzi family protein, partial [Kangiellaceae bacterium]|nr:capsule assembly Wzi family protein [Kangiellaceae bacterium]